MAEAWVRGREGAVGEARVIRAARRASMPCWVMRKD